MKVDYRLNQFISRWEIKRTNPLIIPLAETKIAIVDIRIARAVHKELKILENRFDANT